MFDVMFVTADGWSCSTLVEMAFRHVGLDWQESCRERMPACCVRPTSTRCPAMPARLRQAGLDAESELAQLVTMMVDADMERIGQAIRCESA